LIVANTMALVYNYHFISNNVSSMYNLYGLKINVCVCVCVTVHRIKILWLGLSNCWTIAEIIFMPVTEFFHIWSVYDIQNGTVDQHIGSVVVVIIICYFFLYRKSNRQKLIWGRKASHSWMTSNWMEHNTMAQPVYRLTGTDHVLWNVHCVWTYS